MIWWRALAEGILLVGGFGTRLRPLTTYKPKPMLPIATLPVTEHQLAIAKRAGINTIVLATAYLSEVFIPYFGDGSKWGMQIKYAVENEPLGTGGAIRNAAQLLSGDEDVVVFNGDVLTNHDLIKQLNSHIDNKAALTLHLTPVEDARAYGCVTTDGNKVTAFLEKMDNPITNNINAGCYVFSPKAIESIPLGNVVSVERETFPELIASGQKVLAHVERSYWLDIGTPAALLQGSTDLVRGLADQSALDRYQFAHRGPDYLSRSATGDFAGATSIGVNCQIAGSRITGSIISDGVSIENSTITNSFVAGPVQNANIANSFVAPDGQITEIFSQ